MQCGTIHIPHDWTLQSSRESLDKLTTLKTLKIKIIYDQSVLKSVFTRYHILFCFHSVPTLKLKKTDKGNNYTDTNLCICRYLGCFHSHIYQCPSAEMLAIHWLFCSPMVGKKALSILKKVFVLSFYIVLYTLQGSLNEVSRLNDFKEE